MQETLTPQKRGFIALTSTALILGTFGVLVRALAGSFTDTGQVFVRSFVAMLIIVAIVTYKKLNPFAVPKNQIKYLLAFSIVFPLSILAFTYSANVIKASNSLFMLYVGSLFSTAILGKVLFKEKFTMRHITALVLVVLGLLFFVYPFSIESVSLGLLAGIAAGLLEGTSHTLRKLMHGLKREIVVFYQSISGVTVATLVFLVGVEPLTRDLNMTSIAVALVFGALMVAIGYLLTYGFGNFDVNLGTVILATELFFALIINALILKESPTLYEVIGGSLIFSGTVVTSLQLNGRKKAAS